MNQLDKIEAKLDKLHDKLDKYSERLVHVESSAGWLKWGMSLLISIGSLLAIGISKSLKG